MSNPFDQFDTNPFDQFDKGAEGAKPSLSKTEKFARGAGVTTAKNVINLVDTADRALSGGALWLADLFGQETDAEDIYKKLQERAGKRKQKIKTIEEPLQGQEPSTAAKAAGIFNPVGLASLIGSLPFQTWQTGQEAIEAGETLKKAQNIAGIDLTGNIAGLALPPGLRGKGFIPGAAVGASINMAQDTATRAAIQNVAETEETKKKFEITPETLMLSAAPGVVFGGVYGLSGRKPKGKEPTRADKLDELQKARTQPKPEEGGDLFSSIDAQGKPTFMGGKEGGIPANAVMRVDENGIPYRADLSEQMVQRESDLFDQTPPQRDFFAEEQAVKNQELDFWKQRAEQMAAEARQAELPPEVLRGQQTDPFNPYPVVADPSTMEAMARTQEGVQYRQLPPDAVIPRDAQFFRGERDKPMLRTPRGNEWTVDENGMPVRQGLPETTVDPGYLQRYMRPDEQARNDLGNAIQEVNGPQLSPGREIGSERLAGPVSGDAEIGIGPGLRGPKRGAVNPQIFTPGFTKDKDVGNGLVLRLLGDPTSPIIEAYKDGQQVAFSRFERDNYYKDLDPATDKLQPKWVYTVPDQQKQGIAKEMYRFMAELGNDIIPDGLQTSYGEKLWESMEREGLAQRTSLGPSIPGLTPTRGAVDLRMGPKQKEDFVNNLLRLPQRADMPTAEDVLRDALAEGKDGRGLNNFEAGSSLTALKRKSAAIDGVSKIFQGHNNIAEFNVKEKVFPFEQAVRSLSKTELTDVASVLRKEMFQKKRYDMDLMVEAGFTEKQLLAYKRLRDMQEDVLARQNEGRAERGLPPVTALDAYLSSRWQGDFRRGFRDENGKLLWVLAADSKMQLNNETRQLLKQFPELKKGTYSDTTVRALKNRNDPHQTYQLMVDILGDDPAVAKIKEWYAGKLEEEGASTMAQEKHFEPKGNIRGFIGDRPWRNPTKEALSLLQSQVDYAKNGYHWAEMQKAVKAVKDIVTNKELAEQQPNNMKYIKDYIKENLGANENAAVRGLEDEFRKLGISPNMIGRGINNVKAFWILQKLSFNLGYGAANVFQIVNSIPHVMDLHKKYGGNPIMSTALGTAVGSIMVGTHLTQGPQRVNVYKQLAKILPGDTEWTPFILQAMKYAEDNNVISKSAYDESPIESSFSKTGAAARLASKTIALPDSLRAIAFMTYASQLKSSGKFSDMEAFQMADARTRASMADYNQAEKAMVFSKLGNLGNSLNTLQTFSVNWLNQWGWAIREARSGNMMPAMSMGMIQYALAGAMGIPGFADLDKFLEWSKGILKDIDPKAWAKVRNFSLKEFVINHGGEMSLYGPVSDQSGIAFTSRLAAPAGSEMLSAPGAPFVDLAGLAGSVGKVALDPTNEQKWKQAAYKLAPTGVQGLLETGVMRDDMSVPTEQGTRIYRKPNEMSERAGQYERTPKEETIRATGLRSQKEAVTRDLDWKAKKREMDAKDVVRDLPEKMYNSLRTNNMKSAREWFELHVELTGRPITSEMIQNLVTREYTTPSQRMAIQKNKPLETIMIMKRYEDMMKELGYKE